LSPRSVSELERGVNRTARKDTALLLADALSLAGPVRELFVAAARGRIPAADQARGYHGQALAIACEIGSPLEEARALEGIGQSYLRDGELSQAAAPLREALAVYQRIGSPGGQRVEKNPGPSEL
jgi:hypothetical protein